MRLLPRSTAALLPCLSLLGVACAHVDPAPRELAADSSWLTRARAHIAQREYRVSENDRGLQAPNRAHDLRTYFEKGGIRVHERAGDTAELLRLSLAAVGRGDRLRAVAPGQEIAVRESRVEIRRPGIVE